MKKFLFQSIGLLVVIGGIFYYLLINPSFVGKPVLVDKSFRQLQIGEVQIRVEVADTDNKRKQGLGGRESIASDSGMLFIFDKTGRYPFWMKGLSFPLDFIWIRAEKIVDMTQSVPPPVSGQNDSSLPIYQSKEDIDQLLEVPAGTIQRLNIKVGDTVRLL